MLSFSAEFLSSSLLSKIVKIKIYRIIILCVVLYVCETWCLTLKEVHKLKVFKNSRVLRKIFWPKWKGVRAEWRILHKEEIHDLSSSQRITQVIR